MQGYTENSRDRQLKTSRTVIVNVLNLHRVAKFAKKTLLRNKLQGVLVCVERFQSLCDIIRLLEAMIHLQ